MCLFLCQKVFCPFFSCTLTDKKKLFTCSLSVLLRYHYYGIAVKETSQYYDVMYSKKGAAWVNETGKKEVTKQTVAYSPRSKLGTLLPEFPNVKDLNLPANLPEERVNRTFKNSILTAPPPPPASPPAISPSLCPLWLQPFICPGTFTGFALRGGP